MLTFPVILGHRCPSKATMRVRDKLAIAFGASEHQHSNQHYHRRPHLNVQVIAAFFRNLLKAVHQR